MNNGEDVISSADDTEQSIYKKSKKLKQHGRLSTANKLLKLQSHEMGPDCQCRRQCFQLIPIESRKKILSALNLLGSHDAQNSYLCGLITVIPVQRRRPRSENSRLNDASYSYKVRAMQND